ncbi:MAG TPA: hypothetical protein VJO54_10685 [Burkholderiales bacterium]|nr:hypothetical protein [Burkholderiales bacterium]
MRVLAFALAFACGAAFAQPRLVASLAVVMLEGSGWTRERAESALHRAGDILAQCGVTLEHGDPVVLRVRDDLMDYSTPAAREVARIRPVSRPAVYLVRDTRSRPAFDAEAIGRGNSRTRPEIADTVWMTSGTRDAGIALAHELSHVLMDSGEHSGAEGNLMRDETSPSATRLSPAQCGRLRDKGRANGLLR